MKRIVLMCQRNLFAIPGAWLKLCRYAKHPERYTEAQKLELIHYLAQRANKKGNITLTYSGLEKLPPDTQGYVLYANHQGLYDIVAVYDRFPSLFALMAKKEVKDVPFVKQIMQMTGSYAIDREDIRQSLKVILAISEDVKNGKKFLIFPEGTRGKNGNVPAAFKGGSFKAATKVKAPVVPVCLYNCFLPFDKSSIEQVECQVHILDPIYYEDYQYLSTNTLAELVRERIVEKIAEIEDKQ